MSWEYYDWPSYADSTTGGNWATSNTTSTGSGTWLFDGNSGGTAWTPIRVYHRMLVPRPAGWTKDDEIAFAHLLNKETRTGWNVTMIIDGDVLITDPDIEVREMHAFIPLLKKRASDDDVGKIEAFFEDHPLGESA